MNTNYSGAGVAIVTPFHEDQSIDFESLEKIIEHLISGGINYIVSLGTTGETATLNKQEKQEIVKKTVDIVNGRIPVMVGAGGNNTATIIEDIKEMEQWANFDCFLSVSPYYSKPSQEGIYQHYKHIAEATSKQIILYNVPGRTSRNIEPRTVFTLANDFENIIGIKEAGNSIHQSQELAKNKPQNFTLISGDDDLIFAQMALGFDGVISVVANAYPKEWTQLVHLTKNQEINEARAIFYNMLLFTNQIFEENNPAGIKCALNAMDLCKNEFRLPIVPVSGALHQDINNFVSTFK